MTIEIGQENQDQQANMQSSINEIAGDLGLSEDPVVAAEQCFLQPSAEELMAAIHEGFTFSLNGEEMDTSEVFAADGFLPILSAISVNRIDNMLGFPLFVEEVEDEDSFLGITIRPVFPSAAPFIIYTLMMIAVSEDIFGLQPCNICLDDLFEWATNEEAQKAGLPYLGVN